VNVIIYYWFLVVLTKTYNTGRGGFMKENGDVLRAMQIVANAKKIACDAVGDEMEIDHIVGFALHLSLGILHREGMTFGDYRRALT